MTDQCREAFEKWWETCDMRNGGPLDIATKAISEKSWQVAWNTSANDKGGEGVACRLGELIAEYWEIAYAEGKEGRTEDTPSGAAQKCWTEIWKCLCDITDPPRSTVAEDVRDAARYRWLRKLYRAHSPHMDGTFGHYPPMMEFSARSIDEAIDDAISAGRVENG